MPSPVSGSSRGIRSRDCSSASWIRGHGVRGYMDSNPDNSSASGSSSGNRRAGSSPDKCWACRCGRPDLPASARASTRPHPESKPLGGRRNHRQGRDRNPSAAHTRVGNLADTRRCARRGQQPLHVMLPKQIGVKALYGRQMMTLWYLSQQRRKKNAEAFPTTPRTAVRLAIPRIRSFDSLFCFPSWVGRKFRHRPDRRPFASQTRFAFVRDNPLSSKLYHAIAKCKAKEAKNVDFGMVARTQISTKSVMRVSGNV